MASPFAPDTPFQAGNAMGRNKIIYALSRVTFVASSDKGSGGTWAGAKEALDKRYAPVAVWAGKGARDGNEELARRGATPVAHVADLFDVDPSTGRPNCPEFVKIEAPTSRAIFQLSECRMASMARTTLRAKGQLTLPERFEALAHLEEGDLLDAEITDDGILLRAGRSSIRRRRGSRHRRGRRASVRLTRTGRPAVWQRSTRVRR